MNRFDPDHRQQSAVTFVSRQRESCLDAPIPASIAEIRSAASCSTPASAGRSRRPIAAIGIRVVITLLLVAATGRLDGWWILAAPQPPTARSGQHQTLTDAKQQSDAESLRGDLTAAIGKFEGHEAFMAKFVSAVEADPGASIWLVDLDAGKRAAIQLEKFPAGTSLVHLPGRVRVAKMRALFELVRAEATRELLRRIGLDDAGATDYTIKRASQSGTVAGHIRPELLTAVRHKQVVLGIAVAPRSKIQAAWTQSPGREALFSLYRQAIVDRYQAAIMGKQYNRALRDIEHLMKKPFVRPHEFVAAAQCRSELGDSETAAKLLAHALTMDNAKIDADLLVLVGDRLLELNTENSESLAVEAYDKALKKIQSNQQR